MNVLILGKSAMEILLWAWRVAQTLDEALDLRLRDLAPRQQRNDDVPLAIGVVAIAWLALPSIPL